MKYILILLLSASTLFSQNKNNIYTKVIAYRLVAEYDDGPCSVLNYVRYNDDFAVLTAESTNQEMIKNLLIIREKSKKWKKEHHDCYKGAIGNMDMIDNMFVLYGIRKNDTIFTTANNNSIVIPQKHIQYIDNKQEINNVLTGDMKLFFDRDFRRDRDASYLEVIDSVNVDKLLYMGKKVYQLKKQDIEKQAKEFKVNHIDTFYVNIKDIESRIRNYMADGDIYEFDRNDESIYNIIINTKLLEADGFKIGDSEEILLKKYPNSTKYQYAVDSKFEDIKINYIYVIAIEGNKGFVSVLVKNKVINKIYIEFDNLNKITVLKPK